MTIAAATKMEKHDLFPNGHITPVPSAPRVSDPQHGEHITSPPAFTRCAGTVASPERTSTGKSLDAKPGPARFTAGAAGFFK
jgi:hypothetical protein